MGRTPWWVGVRPIGRLALAGEGDHSGVAGSRCFRLLSANAPATNDRPH